MWMGSDAPLLDISGDTIASFETAVMAVPQFDVANPRMISQGPSVCIFNKENPQEVLASWLFAQYLLSNEVQIAYSETEGYVPVTLKAQNSDAYREYLFRSGEDNNFFYDVKIRASELLLNNIDNTFVTPVWGGSASLRDAAGQLVENTVKSVRRKEEVDQAYIGKLYSDVSALYRLDQSGSQGGLGSADGTDLGALPKTARILLSSLIGAWILIALHVFATATRKKSRKKFDVHIDLPV
jgi:multiple sugar transport system substrate-binding protein